MGGRILVADDDAGVREALGEALREHGFDVDTVVDGSQAIASGRHGAYDLLVLDLQMPGSTGLEVADLLRHESPRLPALFITGSATPATRRSIAAQGRSYLMEKPIDLVRLRENADRLMEGVSRSIHGQRGRVLVVEDHPMTRDVIAETLTNLGYDVTQAGTGEDAVAKAREAPAPFAIAIVDLNLPDRDGVWTIRKLREANPGVVPVAITGEANGDMARRAYQAGAFGFVRKPLDFQCIDAFVHALDREVKVRAARESENLRDRQYLGLRGAWRWVRAQVFCEEPTNTKKRLLLGAAILLAGVLGAYTVQSAPAVYEWTSDRLNRMGTFAQNVEGYLQRDEDRELGRDTWTSPASRRR